MSPDGLMKPPPEEKLLKLIRGKGPRPLGETAVPRRTGPEAAAVASVAGAAHAGESKWVALAVGALSVALAGEVLWLIVQVALPLPRVSTSPGSILQDAAPSRTVDPIPQEIPSIAASAPRPLFTPSLAASAIASSPAAPMSGSTKLVAARLTLTGIVAGDPAQAIIEDSQGNKTYFLTAGQATADGAVLKQILENGVILDLDGEKIELTL